MSISAAITGLIVIFIVGVCFGACLMGLFAAKSYDKGFEDGGLSSEPEEVV